MRAHNKIDNIKPMRCSWRGVVHIVRVSELRSRSANERRAALVDLRPYFTSLSLLA